MKLLLTPSSLRGTVTVPPSKSLLHRELICRFLAGQVTELPPHAAQDVLATYRGLACLTAPAPLVDCGDSGSTLRFLLPLFMALGRTDAVFTGSDRLLSRPIPGDLGLRRTEQGLALTRPLTAGHWSLPGDETSQLISGMLLALPLLPAFRRCLHHRGAAAAAGGLGQYRHRRGRLPALCADDSGGPGSPRRHRGENHRWLAYPRRAVLSPRAAVG